MSATSQEAGNLALGAESEMHEGEPPPKKVCQHPEDVNSSQSYGQLSDEPDIIIDYVSELMRSKIKITSTMHPVVIGCSVDGKGLDAKNGSGNTSCITDLPTVRDDSLKKESKYDDMTKGNWDHSTQTTKYLDGTGDDSPVQLESAECKGDFFGVFKVSFLRNGPAVKKQKQDAGDDKKYEARTGHPAQGASYFQSRRYLPSSYFDFLYLKVISCPVERMSENVEALVESHGNLGMDNILRTIHVLSTTVEYPTESLLNRILRFLLEKGVSEHVSNVVHTYVTKVLWMYPPNKTSRAYYYNACFNPLENGFKWEDILSIIECVSQCYVGDEKSPFPKEQFLLLKLLVTVLTRDFEVSDVIDLFGVRGVTEQALVYFFYFYPENVSNKKFRVLLKYINRLVKPGLDAQLLNLLKCLSQMIFLLVESTRIRRACPEHEALSNTKLDSILDEIFLHCRDVLQNEEKCKIFLNLLKPKWLKVKVLDCLVASVVSNTPVCTAKVPSSLRKIVRQYIFPPIQQKCSVEETEFSEMETDDKNSNQNSTTLGQVMKRNAKGETLIHSLCIRGKAEELKEVLRIPGVNINPRDYAGWTPLHECCNSGNYECAKLLIQWYPSDPNYVTVFTDHLTAADLCASNEGVTPLHEAVASNQTDIAQLLLEYGGPSLTEMKDEESKKPSDYATNCQLLSVVQDGSSNLMWKRKERFDDENFLHAADLSYSRRSCIRFEDSKRSSYYLCLLNFLIKEYLSLRRLIGMRDKLKSTSGGLQHCIETFLPDRKGDNFNYVAELMDDLYVLRDLPEVVKELSKQFTTRPDCDEETRQSCILLQFLLFNVSEN